MGWFSRRDRWPIGLDLGTRSIKMLQLRRQGSGLAVAACGHWEYPLSAGPGTRQRRELAVRAVRDLLRAHKFRGRRVVTALPCEALHVKSLRIAPGGPLPVSRGGRDRGGTIRSGRTGRRPGGSSWQTRSERS